MNLIKNKHAKRSAFALTKPLVAIIAALSLMQTNAAMAEGDEQDQVQVSKLIKGTRMFTNSTPIVINDTCADPEQAECAALLDYYADETLEVPVVPASPYASAIDIPASAFPKGAKIEDVNVYIHDIHHDYLNDVDIMLVAPDGRWVMVASNVSSAGATEEGGVLGVKAEGLNWKFDDSAKLPLPRSVRDDGRLSGRESNPLYNVIYDEWVGVWSDTSLKTWKPTDYDNAPDADYFPDDIITSTTTFNTSKNSAPLTTSTVMGTVDAEDVSTYKKYLNGPALSKFNGMSPTGQWRLVVVDDFYWYAGEIKGGWSLEIKVKR
jgi:subtilisin-like proprotein convertase family protein